MTISTADLHDANPDAVEVCETQFRSFGTRLSFGGPCVTVKVFEDHRPIRALVDEPGNGRVLVIDGGGSLRVGLMGDLIADKARQNGWAGAVIFGVVRDSRKLDRIDFGAKAVGTTAKRGNIESGGIVGVPVSFGGVTFRPGSWVYADVDAVIVSQHELGLG